MISHLGPFLLGSFDGLCLILDLHGLSFLLSFSPLPPSKDWDNYGPKLVLFFMGIWKGACLRCGPRVVSLLFVHGRGLSLLRDSHHTPSSSCWEHLNGDLCGLLSFFSMLESGSHLCVGF